MCLLGTVIEHTNFMPYEDYGEHLVYVTSYFQDEKDVLWMQKEEEVLDSYLKGLEKMFPGFFKERYSLGKTLPQNGHCACV